MLRFDTCHFLEIMDESKKECNKAVDGDLKRGLYRLFQKVEVTLGRYVKFQMEYFVIGWAMFL